MMTTFSVSKEARELFLLKPTYIKYNINGERHYCFNAYNTEILMAKDSIIKDLFFPVTNSLFSNMENQLIEQGGYIHILETEKEQIKKQASFWRKLSAGFGAALLAILLLK